LLKKCVGEPFTNIEKRLRKYNELSKSTMSPQTHIFSAYIAKNTN